MKRKTTFLKTLLVAVGLVTGASAWAETYTGSVSFGAQNRITNNNNGTFTTAGNAGNEYALALADLSGLTNISGASSVTLDFDFNIPSGSRWLIGIGDKTTRGTNANGSNKATYNTDGLVMRFGTTDGTYFRVNGGTNNSNAFAVLAHCTFTLDIINRKYSYTITNKSTSEVLFSASNVNTSISAATVVEAYSWVSNSTVTISDVSYSYEYNAASFTYTVNAVDGSNNVLKVIDSKLVNEPTTVIFPYAINVNGSWYTTSASTFGVNVTAIAPTANITYVKDESIVGFYEGGTGENTAYSSGGYGTVAGQNARNRGTSAGTLTAGQYQFIAKLVADGNSGRAITIREGTNDPFASAFGNNTNKTETVNFTIDHPTGNLYINGANQGTVKTNLSTSFDYIIIKKTGDYTESKTIETAGYATYCSANALDFSGATGLTAYIATVEGSTVSFSPVTSVPANTGVLLKGDAGTYEFTAVASSSTNVENNKLVGVTEETAKDAGIYVLMDGTKGVGFYKTTKTFTVGANTAYLPANVVASAKSFIGFDDVTGIESLKAEKNVADGQWFNLAGQRVMQPKKGLYIVNGKKVIVK